MLYWRFNVPLVVAHSRRVLLSSVAWQRETTGKCCNRSGPAAIIY